MKDINVFGEALATLGNEIATTAADQEDEATKAWEDVKMMFRLANTMGMGKEAIEAIFASGDKVLAKKAIWYRRMKRLLKQVLAYGVDITDLTMKEAIDTVSQYRDGQKSTKQRQQDALRMLERSFKGAVAHAPTEKLLASLQKSIPAAPKRAVSKAN